MSCPPGFILNPHTLRCVRPWGHVAQQLVERGNIADIPRQRPQTYRNQDRWGRDQGYRSQGYRPQGYRPQEYRPQGYRPQGYRSQEYRPQGYRPQGYRPQGYRPNPTQNNYRKTVRPCMPGKIRNPVTRRCIDIRGKVYKMLLNPDKQGQGQGQGQEQQYQQPAKTKEIERPIERERERDSRLPPSWKLYIATDARSGPTFASVMIVDTSKIVRTNGGIKYPPESVKIDLGFIPVNVSGQCSPQRLVDLIQRASEMNRLFKGAQVPVSGFPFSKQYWSGTRVENIMKMNNLCNSLANLTGVGI